MIVESALLSLVLPESISGRMRSLQITVKPGTVLTLERIIFINSCRERIQRIGTDDLIMHRSMEEI